MLGLRHSKCGSQNAWGIFNVKNEKSNAKQPLPLRCVKSPAAVVSRASRTYGVKPLPCSSCVALTNRTVLQQFSRNGRKLHNKLSQAKTESCSCQGSCLSVGCEDVVPWGSGCSLSLFSAIQTLQDQASNDRTRGVSGKPQKTGGQISTTLGMVAKDVVCCSPPCKHEQNLKTKRRNSKR